MGLAIAVPALPASAAGRAPDPVGSSPVSTTPDVVGALRGENGGAMDSCRVGRRDVVVVAGDINRYRALRGDRGVARVWFLDARSGRALGRVSVSGPKRRSRGVRYDAGFVQAVHCEGGRRARVYLGGDFTRVEGRARRHTAMVRVRLAHGKVKRSVTSWQVPFTRPVAVIAPSRGRTLVVAGGSRARAVTQTRGSVRWTVESTCGGFRSAVYARGHVYLGGLFDGVRGPGRSRTSNRGLAKVGASSGRVAPRSSFRTRLPERRGCNSYTGSNPLSLVHDAKRRRIISCEGGVHQAVRAVSRRSGRQAWVHDMDGDAQTCLKIKGRVFVGFHRSEGNLALDGRGCGTRVCGSQAAFFRLSDGRQTRWLLPAGDLAGGGKNRDGRNNGVIGATRAAGWLYLSGGFTQVGRTAAKRIVRFRVQ